MELPNKVIILDRRESPIVWQSRDAIALIRKNVSRTRHNTALRIYAAITELAGLSEDAEPVTRKKLTEYTAYHRNTISTYLQILKNLDLIEDRPCTMNVQGEYQPAAIVLKNPKSETVDRQGLLPCTTDVQGENEPVSSTSIFGKSDPLDRQEFLPCTMNVQGENASVSALLENNNDNVVREMLRETDAPPLLNPGLFFADNGNEAKSSKNANLFKKKEKVNKKKKEIYIYNNKYNNNNNIYIYNTKKKEKLNKKKKEIYKTFISEFNKITGRSFRGDKRSERQFYARLEDGYTLEEFGKAVANCKEDQFHEQNPQYLTPEFITRSDKLEKFLNAVSNKPKVKYLTFNSDK